MKLTDAEIYARVSKFVEDWKDAKDESKHTHAFWIDFFAIFDIPKRKVVTYFERRINHGFADLYWKSVLLVEQKSLGKDLLKAKEQAFSYCDHLEDEYVPKHIIVCDFQHFVLYNLDDDKSYSFTLSELPANIKLFYFMMGEIIVDEKENPVNQKASSLMAKLSNTLSASGYNKNDLGYFLTRLTYCLFADDTGIFEKNAFHDYILTRTSKSGNDVGLKIKRIFEILNTPVDARQTNLDSDLSQFPYIDGDLFKNEIKTPEFNAEMRSLLVNASNFNWSMVSPAIFGNLFQSVMSPDSRHEEGAHYTKEENILRVINPLFMDGLRSELRKIKSKSRSQRQMALKQFQEKLSKMRFLDPACGSGNFLIIAYREIRRMELSVIKELHDPQKQRLDVTRLSRVNVDQFYGLEIDGFSAKIAETALWMMDHLMNRELSAVYGMAYARIPLKKHPKIVCGDAIEYDWNKLLPSAKCSYVLGNPPYSGAKKRTKQQGIQMERLVGKGKKNLDYVTAWFIKAAKYITNDTDVGFVATNSITQGEQVGMLWPLLERAKADILFAHRSFKWGSDAPGMAHVYVVIIGLTKKKRKIKRLVETRDDTYIQEYHKFVSPYLIGSNKKLPVVNASNVELNGLPDIAFGTQPIDGSNYIFTDLQKSEFLKNEPGADVFFRRYTNAKELINGNARWILDLEHANPSELKLLPLTSKRMASVQKFRQKSKRPETRKLAKVPREFGFRPPAPQGKFLAIPSTSAAIREYLPMSFFTRDDITSNATMVINNASVELFGLLSSKMHMTWLRLVGGRLKGDLRYSASVVYNTFPVPDDISSLKIPATNVLNVRKKYKNQALGELYDPRYMPGPLRKAHDKLDLAVDKLYGRKKFGSVHDRMVFLLQAYSFMINKNQKSLDVEGLGKYMSELEDGESKG